MIPRPWRSAVAALIGVAAVTAPAAGQDGFLDANGVRIYHEVEGRGTPLVLIHGWSLNLRMWDLQARDLADEFRVIRMDRRGFGRSTGGEDPTWDPEDLRLLLDELGVKRCHMLGMSQGARIALTFAVAFPDRVRSLILHGSPAPDGFGLPFTGPDRLPNAEFQTLAKTQGLDAARRAWAAHPLMEIPPGRREARERLRELLSAYRGGRWLSPVEPSGPAKLVSMGDLARLHVPTLIIVGDREVPYLRIVADALTYGIAGARKIVIPGGGHMVNIVEPDRYNRAVRSFLHGIGSERQGGPR
jgi:pimeloyl-ACP methyl ester carboxylesterase